MCELNFFILYVPVLEKKNFVNFVNLWKKNCSYSKYKFKNKPAANKITNIDKVSTGNKLIAVSDQPLNNVVEFVQFTNTQINSARK